MLSRRGVAVALAAGLVAASAIWGHQFNAYIGDAAPLSGYVDPRFPAVALPAIAIGLAAIAAAPWLARRLPFRHLLLAVWLMATGWAVALAASDGANGIARPLSTPDEYLPALSHVHGPGHYLNTFVSHVNPAPGQFGWPTHVAGGPPGTLLAFSLLSRVGLGGRVWASLLVILVGTSASAAAVLTARHVAGEATARRAAPFLAFAPLALWIATSADALFLGLSAWGIALLAVAAGPATATKQADDASGRSRFGRGDVAALTGGVLLGLALFCSYGIAPMAGLAVAVVVRRRRVRPLVFGVIGVAVVTALFAASGFWWWDGLAATRIRYAEGIARVRPYGYFFFADLAALTVAVGPATIAGLASLRRRSRLWWPVGGALLAVAASDISGLSKGEVERIWLPFGIWLLLATSCLGSSVARRRWLAAQIALAIVVQLLITTNW